MIKKIVSICQSVQRFSFWKIKLDLLEFKSDSNNHSLRQTLWNWNWMLKCSLWDGWTVPIPTRVMPDSGGYARHIQTRMEFIFECAPHSTVNFGGTQGMPMSLQHQHQRTKCHPLFSSKRLLCIVWRWMAYLSVCSFTLINYSQDIPMHILANASIDIFYFFSCECVCVCLYREIPLPHEHALFELLSWQFSIPAPHTHTHRANVVSVLLCRVCAVCVSCTSSFASKKLIKNKKKRNHYQWQNTFFSHIVQRIGIVSLSDVDGECNIMWSTQPSTTFKREKNINTNRRWEHRHRQTTKHKNRSKRAIEMWRRAKPTTKKE